MMLCFFRTLRPYIIRLDSHHAWFIYLFVVETIASICQLRNNRLHIYILQKQGFSASFRLQPVKFIEQEANITYICPNRSLTPNKRGVWFVLCDRAYILDDVLMYRLIGDIVFLIQVNSICRQRCQLYEYINNAVVKRMYIFIFFHLIWLQ